MYINQQILLDMAYIPTKPLSYYIWESWPLLFALLTAFSIINRKQYALKFYIKTFSEIKLYQCLLCLNLILFFSFAHKIVY